ncbi:Hypothetical protein CINCED_3A000067 [Cinara cedri]|uniref:Zinc finger, RING/FYVE/PHD-type n=1 Tax=Cinara cedri TaxID=506608 RepID=A0A5E4MPS5_9HEMI|nr:Hypothetical protein CINCED_3A000067 [Cinara cedri]
MPKIKCTFNEKLQSEYTFLKKCQKPAQEYKIECIVCGAAFSIEHGEQKLAADEGIFAYHTCKHSQSLSSMDCTSQLVRKLYVNKFTRGRTKTKSIITNVFLPYAVNVLKKDLLK